MTKKRMDKLTTIADRKEWAQKVLYRHNELMDGATRKIKRRIDVI